tara:strand:+ start:507 stop:635 length:129 start_codon:yes stop_codon:yes gene_type:complete
VSLARLSFATEINQREALNDVCAAHEVVSGAGFGFYSDKKSR